MGGGKSCILSLLKPDAQVQDPARQKAETEGEGRTGGTLSSF